MFLLYALIGALAASLLAFFVMLNMNSYRAQFFVMIGR